MTALPARVRPGRLVPILAFSAAAGMLASSIHIPSIPSIARDFEASVGTIQLSVTVFLVAFAIGTLLHGPLSDRFGRRPVLFVGMAVGAVGSLGCAVAPSEAWFLICRVVQAAGVCTGMTVGRAVLRDVFSGEGARRPMSVLALAGGLAPALAPTMGGLFEVGLGWRSQFYFMAAYSALMGLLIVLWVEESNERPVRGSAFIGGMLAGFRELTTNRAFLYYTAVATCGSCCFFFYTVGVPAVLSEQFGLGAARIGLYAAFPPIGYITFSLILARFGHLLSIDAFIRIGSVGLAATGALLLAISTVGNVDPLVICAPAVFIGMSNAILIPNAFAGSVNVNPRIAGAASGLAGFVQMIAGAGAAALAGSIPHDDIQVLMAALMAFGVAALAIGFLGRPLRIA